MIPIFFVAFMGALLCHLNDAKITNFTKKMYFTYFKVKLGDQNKSWASHKVCKSRVESLRYWSKEKNRHLKFGILMIPREQRNHVNDFYFCLVNVKGYKKKNKTCCNIQV